MNQIKNLIKYKIDIQNGEFSKEEYPIIKVGTEYKQEGYYKISYDIYHYQLNENTVCNISEQNINKILQTYLGENKIFIFCLENEKDLDNDNLKLIQNLFLDYIKERRNYMEQRYQEAIITYNKENSLLNNIEQQIMDLTNGQEIEEERSDLE